MKYYVAEIPGKVHDKNEDAHYGRIFQDGKRNSFGLFMVADGCSGYAGIIGSNQAVRSVAFDLEQKIKMMGKGEYTSVIKDSLVVANEALYKLPAQPRTTFDLVLVCPDSFYVAHLGDSRVYGVYGDKVTQFTEDQSLRGAPTNYLGVPSIDRKSIEERIIIQKYDYSMNNKPDLILLTTDGLVSRVSEAAIKQTLCSLKEVIDPSIILERLVDEVHIPSSQIATVKEYDLIHILSSSDEKVDRDVKGGLVEKLIEIYSSGSNAQIIEKVDALFKFDDTTMILVDLSDRVAGNFERAKYRLGELEHSVSSYELQVKTLNRNISSKDMEIVRLGSELAVEKKRVTVLTTEKSALGIEFEVVKKERDMYRDDYSSIETKVSEIILKGDVKDDSVVVLAIKRIVSKVAGVAKSGAKRIVKTVKDDLKR